METVPVLEKPAPMTCRLQSGSLLGLEATPPIFTSSVPFHTVGRSTACMMLLQRDMTERRPEPRRMQINFILGCFLSLFRQSGNFLKLKPPIGLHSETRRALRFESLMVF